jgi:uncharacterized protein
MPYATGKICYIELPAIDVERSAEFYERSFGWTIRRPGDGSVTFEDTVGCVSGVWVLDRPPASSPGLLIYVMVADAAASLGAILAAGGEVVQPVDPNHREVFAHFSDPAGNVLGIYQQRGLADTEAVGGSER